MPLSHREVLQLGLLLLCVPLQYFLGGTYSSGMGRSQAVLHLARELRYFKDFWFSVDAWKNRWLQVVSWLLGGTKLSAYSLVNGRETCPAIEVLQYRERAGYFATSLHVRSERPDHLQFRVGQVVRHRTLGYRAVIIGWDLEAMAPKSWLTARYGDSKVLRHRPHYALLIDKRDRKPHHQTYVVQEQLEVVKNTEIQHAHIEERFSYFDGAQYIPRPKLKVLYPRD